MPSFNVSGAISTPQDDGTGLSSGEPRDWNSAGHTAAMGNISNATNYVEGGLGLTLDAATPALDIGSGQVRLHWSGTTSVQDTNGDYANTWGSGVTFVVDLKAVTGISLTDGDVNHVYVSMDRSTNNGLQYVVNTTASAPSEPSLKIGEVDTSADTVTELNRAPDGEYDNLAAGGSFTDPAGVEHTGELADAGDTGGNKDTAYPFSETGEVATGDAGIIITTRIADGESFEVTQAGFGVVGSGAPPSGLNISIITLDASWSGTEQAVVLSGDGTNQTDVTGGPIASYTNTTGGEQDVALVVDNGQFSASGTGGTEQVVAQGDAGVV